MNKPSMPTAEDGKLFIGFATSCLASSAISHFVFTKAIERGWSTLASASLAGASSLFGFTLLAAATGAIVGSATDDVIVGIPVVSEDGALKEVPVGA